MELKPCIVQISSISEVIRCDENITKYFETDNSFALLWKDGQSLITKKQYRYLWRCLFKKEYYTIYKIILKFGFKKLTNKKNTLKVESASVAE